MNLKLINDIRDEMLENIENHPGITLSSQELWLLKNKMRFHFSNQPDLEESADWLLNFYFPSGRGDF